MFKVKSSKEYVDEMEKVTEEKLLEERKRADDNWDKYIRQVAENRNFKKRMDKEMESFKAFANESIIKDLLVVSDNLWLAWEAADKEEPSQGLLLILKEMHKVFGKYGVRPIEAVGEDFDPQKMESVDTMESDGPPNKVVMVLQEGYTLHSRLLRPAKVIISKERTQ